MRINATCTNWHKHTRGTLQTRDIEIMPSVRYAPTPIQGELTLTDTEGNKINIHLSYAGMMELSKQIQHCLRAEDSNYGN